MMNNDDIIANPKNKSKKRRNRNRKKKILSFETLEAPVSLEERVRTDIEQLITQNADLKAKLAESEVKLSVTREWWGDCLTKLAGCRTELAGHKVALVESQVELILSKQRCQELEEENERLKAEKIGWEEEDEGECEEDEEIVEDEQEWEGGSGENREVEEEEGASVDSVDYDDEYDNDEDDLFENEGLSYDWNPNQYRCFRDRHRYSDDGGGHMRWHAHKEMK